MTPIGQLRADLSALRGYVQRAIEEIIPARLFGWTLSAASSALGDKDAVETADDGKSQRPAQRTEPFGYRGRPPGKLRSLWLRLGSSNVVFIGIAPTSRYGPGDLEEGEVAMYNISKALVRLWKTGKITLDADSGQDVVVNGGTLQVARKTDKVIVDTTMATWIAAVTTAFNAPIAPMASAPGTLTPPTNFGVINGGAANFKA